MAKVDSSGTYPVAVRDGGVSKGQAHVFDFVGDGVVATRAKMVSTITVNKVDSAARTATAAPGGTTGVIADGINFVVVTSDDANKVITLPTPTPGQKVSIMNGATGYELRSSAPATVGINGGTGANAESAVAATTLVSCECSVATNWICWSRIASGVLSVVEVAAP